METLTQEAVQVRVNDQLVEIDNLITALNYLKEEVQTTVMSRDNITTIVKDYLSDETFYRRIREYLRRHQIKNIAAFVADDVKTDINNHLESFLYSKLDERINMVLSARGQ
jgi:hypothetical protein